ncbi:hypothetical protein [Neptunomonas concharum]|uniref:Uncharacterized protein n=1 Tax=Neptunomonas concharum TaxID=1031538 RepID=A0A5P1RCK8_9GAMM|nr:hypothetical protein [Neptunomonas concharum]QEQ97399.1 hypothetical protein F0U83_12120 [Neptunomonas concharum]
MDKVFLKRIQVYQATAIFSVIFALVGFSYNVWRMEISEENNNIRTAAFEMLKELADLEQLVYVAHYDGDEKEGSPRKGWVSVGLINELSILAGDNVQMRAQSLHEIWSKHWSSMPTEMDSVNAIIESIEQVRIEIRGVLISLE